MRNAYEVVGAFGTENGDGDEDRDGSRPLGLFRKIRGGSVSEAASCGWTKRGMILESRVMARRLFFGTPGYGTRVSRGM